MRKLVSGYYSLIAYCESQPANGQGVWEASQEDSGLWKGCGAEKIYLRQDQETLRIKKRWEIIF